MAKRSKKYRAAAEKILPGILYSPFEAMKLAKETSVTSFPSTVEGVVRLIGRADTLQACPGQRPPMVVHCSAGCGRTGTFCALDILLRYMRDNPEQWMGSDTDLVYATVSSLRLQRKGMVKTFDQFIFCYIALLYCTDNWPTVLAQFAAAVG